MTAKDIIPELLDFELELKLPAKPKRSIVLGPNIAADPMTLVSDLLPRIQSELNAVLGQSQIVNGRHSEDDAGLEMIRECAERAIGFIQQSRLLLQIECGQYQIKYEPLSLAIMLDLLEAITRPLAEAKGLTCRIHKDEGLPDSVYTCGRALRYCLLQLRENAIRFTDKGEVDLHISHHEKQSKAYLCFTVSNSALGIEENDKHAVFQPFFQVNPNGQDGSGLGLTLTERLADKLYGRLSLDSRPVRGTAITLEIPVGHDPADQSPSEKRKNSLRAPNKMA